MRVKVSYMQIYAFYIWGLSIHRFCEEEDDLALIYQKWGTTVYPEVDCCTHDSYIFYYWNSILFSIMTVTCSLLRHLNRCKMASHYGFHLHFLMVSETSMLSGTCCLYSYSLWGKKNLFVIQSWVSNLHWIFLER